MINFFRICFDSVIINRIKMWKVDTMLMVVEGFHKLDCSWSSRHLLQRHLLRRLKLLILITAACLKHQNVDAQSIGKKSSIHCITFKKNCRCRGQSYMGLGSNQLLSPSPSTLLNMYHTVTFSTKLSLII